MLLPRLLQFFMAALAALGTSMLGISQHDGVFPVVGIFVAVTSFYFTDVLRWFWINRTFGNALALGAIAYAVYDFYFRTIDDDLQLLAIANLLVYLQMILLYQQKSERRYWEILALSLLQVVVAAALNLSVAFGALLVVYMLVAFTALGLFFVFRERLRLEGAVESGEAQPMPAASLTVEQLGLQRRLLGNPPELVAATPPVSWQAMLGWGFARQVAGVSLLTLGFVLVLFFVIPRTGNSSALNAALAASHVGFNAEVRLGDVVDIQQSGEIAMLVEFNTPEDENPMEVGSFYLTGNILTTYAGAFWSNATRNTTPAGTTGQGSQDQSAQNSSWQLAPPPAGQQVLWQKITLHPRNDGLLFSTLPVFAAPQPNDRLRYFDRGRLASVSRYGASAAPYAYVVATAAFGRGTQAKVTPYVRGPGKTDAMLASELQQLAQLNRPERFPSIVSVANSVVARRNLAPGDRVAIAESLLDHFTLPGSYTYTLDTRGLPRDTELDPVEDFVRNHHSGHCEYFATAMCLMLRSQNIPARLVVGYLGSEYNSLGGYYQVREREAHAWVEVYLEPSQIPPGSLPPGMAAPDGGWMRLDPTPADALSRQRASSLSLLARARDAFNVAQLLWDDYVLGLDAQRQRETISASWLSVTAPFIQSVDRVTRSIIPDAETRSTSWFRWSVGLVVLVACAALILSYQLATFLWRKLQKRWPNLQHAAAPKAHTVDFYLRFEKLLAGLGIQRQAGQTQREFAEHTAQQLAAVPAAGAVADVPAQIVAAFYDVRFGQAALNGQQEETVTHALDRLAVALAPKPAKPTEPRPPTP